MKFLIHIPQLIYGGAEKVLVDFANYLIEKGHEVEVLETYDRGFLKQQFNSKVTFNCICSNEYTDKYYVSFDEIVNEKNIFKKVKKIIKKVFITIVGYERLAHYFAKKNYKDKRFDVAINYLETQSPKFIIKSIYSRKKLQWIHIDISKVNNIEFIDKQIKWYKKIDNIICVSEVAKVSFYNRFYELRNKTKIIYNFYNVNKIIETSVEAGKLNQNEFSILSVGRLVEQKGYERAINVFYRLKQEGYKFKWHIIGDGILKEKINNKINDLGLAEDIYLLGIKENPYPYIKQCDLFFLPSLYEGFPTVTIEAKVLKKPVLSTEVSGIREQIINGKTGLIVDNSEEAIYIGLKKLISNDELRNKIQSNEGIDKVINNEFKYKELMKIMDRWYLN